jgi:hypothetical protein
MDDTISLNKNVTMTADIVFVIGFTFMVSISQKIKFTTILYLPGRSQPLLFKSLKNILHLYTQWGFIVENVLMDRDFKSLRYDIPELHLNTTVASKHLPEIERQLKGIKERMRAIRSTLPFKRIPSRILIEIMQYMVL